MLDFGPIKEFLTDQGYHLDMIQPNEDKSITLTISPTGEVSQGALDRWNKAQDETMGNVKALSKIELKP